MNAGERTEAVIGWAVEAGFDRAGVAALQPIGNGGRFLEWLAEGHHGGMGYLARRIEARLDPRKLFEGARSALCVALQYAPPSSCGHGELQETDLWRGTARYARGADYHDVMGRRLAELSKRIEKAFPGTRTRCYVDTGPVLERELAAAAGVGVIGKNTCLLHPEAGSWFLVAEVFMSLELAATPSLSDLCGSCSRCLEACPTGALKEPYLLDSNRCISYWTIEHRGQIPREVRSLLGGWVFGCDACQEVCPANESATVTGHPDLAPSPQRASLDLEGLVSLEVESYREVFRGSAMKRAKLAGLKRNAIIAMGNSGRSAHIDTLEVVLAGDDADLRGIAAWALGRIGGPRANEALQRVAEVETDTSARVEIDRALEEIEQAS